MDVIPISFIYEIQSEIIPAIRAFGHQKNRNCFFNNGHGHQQKTAGNQAHIRCRRDDRAEYGLVEAPEMM